jgi:hypothetical protein
MEWTDKSGTAQVSDIVLTISNWHYNRDTLKDAVAPYCKLENVMVTLKLSSSVFEPPTAPTGGVTADDPEPPATEETSSNSGDKTFVSSDGDVYYFDRNGCIIPYVAFHQLLANEEFAKYLEEVKVRYDSKTGPEKKGPSTPPPVPTEDLAKIREEKKRKLAMLYGRNRKRPAINFADDDDVDCVGDKKGGGGYDDDDDDDDVDDDNDDGKNQKPNSPISSQYPDDYYLEPEPETSVTKSGRKRGQKK